MDYIFTTRMSVRDYECDIQGIVNNANYLHYTEHTRHLYLKKLGLSFADMHRQGEDVVVARMTMQFKSPLRCDDEFLSCLNVRKQGLRYVFEQDIYRTADNKLCYRAQIDIVCLKNGKLAASCSFDKVMK